MPNPNADLLDSPRSRDMQFDLDYQERRLHAMLDEIYKMHSALRDIKAGVTPKRILDIDQKTAYDDQVAALQTALIDATEALKAIDALVAA